VIHLRDELAAVQPTPLDTLVEQVVVDEDFVENYLSSKN
jgi:hypothetical protein